MCSPALDGDLTEPLEEIAVVRGVDPQLRLKLRRREALAADAGRAVEGIDAEAGVVGECRQAGAVSEVASFGERVGSERIVALEILLRRGRLETEVAQADESDGTAVEEVGDLGELVRLSRRDEEPQRSPSAPSPLAALRPSLSRRLVEWIRSTSAEVERPGTAGKIATSPPRASTMSLPTT